MSFLKGYLASVLTLVHGCAMVWEYNKSMGLCKLAGILQFAIMIPSAFIAVSLCYPVQYVYEIVKERREKRAVNKYATVQ